MTLCRRNSRRRGKAGGGPRERGWFAGETRWELKERKSRAGEEKGRR